MPALLESGKMKKKEEKKKTSSKKHSDHVQKNDTEAVKLKAQEDPPHEISTAKERKWSVSTIVLAITMLAIFWQAFETNRSVALQQRLNDSNLRPYIAFDPSIEAPFIQDSHIVVRSSLTNYGKTPAYEVVLIGRVTNSDVYPDSLLRALIETDDEGTIAIAYPSQPGFTFTGESVIRDLSGNSMLGVTLDSLVQSCEALYYHVYIEYESGWNKTYYLRSTYRYEGHTLWSTIYASEYP